MGYLSGDLTSPRYWVLAKLTRGPLRGHLLHTLCPQCPSSSPLSDPPCCWLLEGLRLGFAPWAVFLSHPVYKAQPRQRQGAWQPPWPLNLLSCSQGWLWVSRHPHPGSGCLGAPGRPWQPPGPRLEPARAVRMTGRM